MRPLVDYPTEGSTDFERRVVAEYQKSRRPFVWKVDADEILRKVAKLRQLQETAKRTPNS